MKKILFGFVALMLVANAYTQETLPPYHWSNAYINYFKVRGYLDGLNHLNRPYDRQEIAQALVQLDSLPFSDRAMYHLLLKEFHKEIVLISKEPESRLARLAIKALRLLSVKAQTLNPQQRIAAGAFVQGVYDTSAQKISFEIHPHISWRPDDHFFFYTNFKIFNRAAPSYDGKKFSGLYAYNEQAYTVYKNDWLFAKVGRDWLQLGPGRSGQLLFSANSRPFDMYYVALGKHLLSFQFWGIMLNRRPIREQPAAKYAATAGRFINGHRIALNFKNRYRFALNEVILYGGPNVSWEAAYVNPAMLYYAYNVNTRSLDANMFYSLEWDLFFKPLEIYGEFIVDDFQIEKKVPADLEPNELGLLAGLQWANPFHIPAGLANLEFVQIRNRTYNAPVHDWEKFLHRNQVIGYQLGNNLESYSLSLQKWFKGNVETGLCFMYVRQGEGSVADSFNTDYMKHTTVENYSEPFPYGIVENHFQVGGRFFYMPFRNGHINLQIAFNQFENYGHIRGKTHNEWSFRAGLWLEWEKLFVLER